MPDFDHTQLTEDQRRARFLTQVRTTATQGVRSDLPPRVASSAESMISLAENAQELHDKATELEGEAGKAVRALRTDLAKMETGFVHDLDASDVRRASEIAGIVGTEAARIQQQLGSDAASAGLVDRVAAVIAYGEIQAGETKKGHVTPNAVGLEQYVLEELRELHTALESPSKGDRAKALVGRPTKASVALQKVTAAVEGYRVKPSKLPDGTFGQNERLRPAIDACAAKPELAQVAAGVQIKQEQAKAATGAANAFGRAISSAEDAPWSLISANFDGTFKPGALYYGKTPQETDRLMVDSVRRPSPFGSAAPTLQKGGELR